MELKSNLLFQDKSYHLKDSANFPIIITDQLKSPENMGHIIRLAANFNCIKVLFIGEKSLVRESKIKKVAGAAFDRIDWRFCTIDDLTENIPNDYKIIGIETAKNSKDLSKVTLPAKSALVLGNEIRGISDQLLEKCADFFHIPMTGMIPSMNVTHACAVSLFAWTSSFVA